MNFESQIIFWSKIGNHFSSLSSPILKEAIQKATYANPWFREEEVVYAFNQWGALLTENNLRIWLQPYEVLLTNQKESKRIGIVMAGNIPLVGFHDFLCVLLCNHSIEVKLSQDDAHLLPAITELLCDLDPAFSKKINFTSGKLSRFDAIIATGSNNTARYFDYYFGKYPHIIRKNRNSITILTGNESDEELESLAKDVFMYFGLGCRSISKLFVPEFYDFSRLQKAFDLYRSYLDHFKYSSSYLYHRAIYMMSSVEYIDFETIMLVNSTELSAPVGVLNYSYYSSLQQLNEYIRQEKDKLQCIVTSVPEIQGSISFGKAQSPQLNDYADQIDTLDFLLRL